MAHRYFVFTNLPPASVRITLAHDSGWGGTAVPATDPQGRAGSVFDLPDSVPMNNGAQVNLDAEGKVPIQVRGVLTDSLVDPTRAYLQVDDFVLVDLPTAPEPPPPDPGPGPSPSTPLEVINAVYASGNYNLATKPGCGTFTEECCRQLAAAFGSQWGHVAKSPGQNQYNNHAVDALYALYGSDAGIWDIIVSSVSSSAHPAFNNAGDGDPEQWRPPAPLPVQPMGASSRQVTLTLSVENLVRLVTLLKHT